MYKTAVSDIMNYEGAQTSSFTGDVAIRADGIE